VKQSAIGVPRGAPRLQVSGGAMKIAGSLVEQGSRMPTGRRAMDGGR